MDSHTLESLSTFLEAAVHLVLYARKVYPQEVFQRRRLLDVTVFRSRHVELNDHIALVARGARDLMARGEADALVVSILGVPPGDASARPQPLERFRFELRQPAAGGGHSGGGSAEDDEALRAHLRGCLLKLHVCDALLAPLPWAELDLSFRCELHTAATSAPQPMPAQLLQQWTETSDGGGGSAAGGSASGDSEHLLPLHSFKIVDGLSLSLTVRAAAMPVAT